MRPRPEGRGERWTTWPVGGRSVLLQCGHDPKAVENVRIAADGHAGRPASMRPRPEGRGERASATTPRRCTICFNAATTRRPWRTSTWHHVCLRTTALQCGHDPKAVENALVIVSVCVPMLCFNAATTRRPWRTSFKVRSCGCLAKASMRPRPEGRGERHGQPGKAAHPTQLQCGHDPKAVENPAVESAGRPGRASMRPRPEGRGEPRPPAGRRPAAGRFNAATTRRPWRTILGTDQYRG